MEKPDERLFDEDLSSVAFRNGVERGQWGLPTPEELPGSLSWPHRIVWLGAAPRPGAPDRFYVRLDAAGYPTSRLTGTFWDLITNTALTESKRPKGRPDSRFTKVFRTDWEHGAAFYHPYDRIAAKGHPGWLTDQPHLVWSSAHTIVDYLEEFASLLRSGDYCGI